jgi:hypothetical protein
MKSTNKLLVVLNTISLIAMIFVNYGSNAGLFGTISIGEMSRRYENLFTPAGYAFSIWGILFLGVTAFVIYQWLLLKSGDPRNYISRTGPWLLISNLANSFWVVAWVHDQIGLSVLLILLLLISLIVLTYRLRLEMDDEPIRTVFFVWWPIVFYLGWIVAATVACIASWLISLGWRGGPLSEPVWTIVMIIIAALIYLTLISKRNMREAAMVGAWAFIAIAVKHWNDYNQIAITAAAAATLLVIAGGIHGYKNREYGIGKKIQRGEWK